MAIFKLDIDTKKLKNIQLNIFQVVIGICKAHNIRYFCIGGTALGAVRHGGFIPWDDDIDIAMLRPDYEKFIAVAKAELPSYYFLQNYTSDLDFRYQFSKIRDSRTTFLESAAKNLKINHGVYIDIFVIDGYPNNKRQAKKMIQLNRLVKTYCSKDFVAHRSKMVNIKIFASKIFFLFRKPQKVLRLFDDKCKSIKFDTCIKLICFCGMYGQKDIWPKEWFDDVAKMRFEGFEVNVPIGYHMYLTQIYGDYMKLPPVEERVAHHFCDVIDLNNPYTKYTNY